MTSGEAFKHYVTTHTAADEELKAFFTTPCLEAPKPGTDAWRFLGSEHIAEAGGNFHRMAALSSHYFLSAFVHVIRKFPAIDYSFDAAFPALILPFRSSPGTSSARRGFLFLRALFLVSISPSFARFVVSIVWR